MLKVKGCHLCGSSNLEILVYGDIYIDKCNICEFQYIPNNFNYISNDHFSNYFKKRSEKENLGLNNKRIKQYKIDVEVISEYFETPPKRVLDIGCSSGMFISEIYERYKPEQILGIDIDNSAISHAKKSYGDIADFSNIDLLNINNTEEFDLIVFRGTFQYLDQSLHESVKYIKNLLAENGRIIIFSLPSTDAFLYHLLQNDWALFHPEMSLMFNEKSIRVLLSNNDLKIHNLSYPYLNDTYSNIEHDYENVKQIILGNTRRSNPFWGSLMQLVISNKE